jgi:cytochrome c peroxidase
MTRRPKMLAAAALVTTAALVVSGCPQNKKSAPAGTTSGQVTVEETVVEEEMPKESNKQKAVAEPSEEPPAPEEKAKEAPPETSGKVMLGSPELTAGIPGSGPLEMEEIEVWLADPKNHDPLDFELPMGLAAGAGQVKGVDRNPLTRAKIELGRQLYFDPRLSTDATISCASCHDPDEGFARHTQFGEGIKGQKGGRNSPVSYNRILSDNQFWDGRAGSLEDQAVGPIANPIEMGNTHEACVEALAGIPGYKAQFDKIFGRLDIDAVAEAIASFERAIVTAPAPFDYYEQLRPFEKLDKQDIEDDPDLKKRYDAALAAAEAHPLSESAKRGRELYFSDKAGCSACHVGANLTDEKYHNIGVGMDKENPDIGREEVTKDAKDKGAFKTPTIRDVAKSAPYMHDGSQKDLVEVVEFYAKGGHPNPNLDEKIKKLDLSDQDKKDLVEFLVEGCTSDFPKIERGRLPK